MCIGVFFCSCTCLKAYLVDLRRPNDIAMIFSGHTSEVYAAQFDDKATTLFTGSRDGVSASLRSLT